MKLTISDYTGKVVRNLTGTKEVGLNRVQWNLRSDPPQRPTTGGGFGGGGGGGGGGGFGNIFTQGLPLDAGTYTLTVSRDGSEPRSVLLSLAAGEVRTVNVALAPRASVSGTVLRLKPDASA